MEIIVVLVIGLIIVGPKKLPGLGKSLGHGMRQFRDSMSGDSHDDEIEVAPVAQVPAVAATTAAKD